MSKRIVLCVLAAAGLALSGCSKSETAATGAAKAEVGSVLIGVQNGVAYIPFHVMADQQLIEKHAKALGIELKGEVRNLGSAQFVRDALIAGQIQFGVAGPPTLVTMHDKTGGDIKAVGAVVSLPMYLNTTNPKIKTVCDFGPGDKIALPTVKSSVQAVALQIATKELCGDPFRDDTYTVSMAHPDGYNALMSGTVNSHMTTPPFSFNELERGKGKVRRVLNSYDLFGGKSTLVLLLASDKFRLANPKAYQAVSEAFAEATAYVRDNPRPAAELYLKAEKSNETLDEVMKQLSSPEIEYTTVPATVGRYASFMHEIGTVKSLYDLKALSMPDLYGKGGS